MLSSDRRPRTKRPGRRGRRPGRWESSRLRLGCLAGDVDPGVAVRGAVEDRPAEGRALDAVAVGPERVVPAGEHPFERLVGAGLAEDGDAVVLHPAVVVVHLLLEPLVALLAAKALEDLVAEGPLLLRQ